MKFAVLILSAMSAFAQNYTAVKNADGTLRLADRGRAMEVAIAPATGNMAYEFNVKGQNVFFFVRGTSLTANQFLAPWANRLDQDAFYANGKKYLLNPGLNNLRRDPAGHPIHGLLFSYPGWEVASLRADDSGAEATSRLEFWRHPALMAQFPFAHAIEMTYRLSDGALEVRTRIENQSKEPMPLLIGYHPYFQLHDSPRDQWKVHVAARDHVEISKELIPTGEVTPVKIADPQPLAGTQVDDIFTNLVREPDGRAAFWLEGKAQRITVVYGPKYNTAIVYAPPGKEFVCIEPMTGITNAFNLAQAGVYKDLQSVPAGGVWEESYWIKPTGF